MKLPLSDGLLTIEWFREGNWKIPEEAGRLNKAGFRLSSSQLNLPWAGVLRWEYITWEDRTGWGARSLAFVSMAYCDI